MAAAIHALGGGPQLSTLASLQTIDMQEQSSYTPYVSGKTWPKVYTGDSVNSNGNVDAVSFASPSSIWHASAQATGDVSLDAQLSDGAPRRRSLHRVSLDSAVPRLPQGSLRRRVHYVLEARLFKGLVALVILVNAWQVIYETDTTQDCRYATDDQLRNDACEDVDGWLSALNIFYLAFYTIELFLRIYVDQLSFFFSKWDLFDFVVVIGSVIGQVVSVYASGNTFGVLRLCRMLRLFKAFRWVSLPRELHIMVHGILGAIRATLYGFLLLSAMLIFWSVLAVEILNEANHDDDLLRYYEEVSCERCPRAWASVWQSCLSLLQITLMGDSWGRLALPLVEKHPHTVLLFAGAFLTIAMILVNLILAVILEKALQQRHEDAAQTAQEQERLARRAKRGFVELCRRIDSDQSGYLSLAEYLDGYESVRGFRDQLTIMGIGSDDLETLFHMMDKNRSGSVSYEDFADQLVTMKNQDLHAMSSFIKHQIVELANELADLKTAVVPREEVVRLQNARKVGSRSSVNLSYSTSGVSGNGPTGSSKGGSQLSLPATSSTSLTQAEHGKQDLQTLEEDRPRGNLRRAATGQSAKMPTKELRQHASPTMEHTRPSAQQEMAVLIDVLHELKTITEHLRLNAHERKPKADAGHLEAGQHKGDNGQATPVSLTPVSGSPKSHTSGREARIGTDHAHASNGRIDPQSYHSTAATHHPTGETRNGMVDCTDPFEHPSRTIADTGAVEEAGGTNLLAEIQVDTRPSATPFKHGDQAQAAWCQQWYCRHVPPEEHEMIPLERDVVH